MNTCAVCTDGKINLLIFLLTWQNSWFRNICQVFHTGYFVLNSYYLGSVSDSTSCIILEVHVTKSYTCGPAMTTMSWLSRDVDRVNLNCRINICIMRSIFSTCVFIFTQFTCHPIDDILLKKSALNPQEFKIIIETTLISTTSL